MKKLGLILEPLDVLFFRDARPFGPATQAQGGLPLPQTLAGALITALLKRYDRPFPKSADAIRQSCGAEQRWIADLCLRGPWLARQR